MNTVRNDAFARKTTGVFSVKKVSTILLALLLALSLLPATALPAFADEGEQATIESPEQVGDTEEGTVPADELDPSGEDAFELSALDEALSGGQDDADLSATAAEEDLDALAGIATGWVNNQNGTWSYARSGELVRGSWVQVNGSWYYFDDDAIMFADTCREIDGKWYVFKVSGEMAHSGWQKYIVSIDPLNVNWYYLNPGGDAVVGWQQIGGSRYYFENINSVSPFMYEGPNEAPNPSAGGNQWYIFANSGALATNGWLKYTNQDGSYDWFYANPDGTARRGWQTIGGAKYYFETALYERPNMYVGIYEIAGSETPEESWYYFNTSGALVTSGWIDYSTLVDDGNPCKIYVDESGALAEGWKTINNATYYFGKTPPWGTEYVVPVMYIGLSEIGDKYYAFKDSGAQVKGAWYEHTYPWGGKIWSYLSSEDGSALRGYQEIGSSCYYFDEFLNNPPRMNTGPQKVGETWYYFGDSGAQVTKPGWLKMSIRDSYYDWFYVKADGTLQTGYQQIGSNWYYFFDAYGASFPSMQVGVHQIGGGWHFFDSSGAESSASGWLKITYTSYDRTVWFYKNQDGTFAEGEKQIGGSTYYFAESTLYTAYQMATGLRRINETWHFYGASGAEVTTPGWANISDNSSYAYDVWVYILPNGEFARGLQPIGGSTYYFNQDSLQEPVMRSDYKVVDDQSIYYFGSTGRAITNEWYKDTYPVEAWRYLDETGKAVKEGWKQVKGAWYYFVDNAMLSQQWINDGVKPYYLTSSGAMATGWTYVDPEAGLRPILYWFAENGDLATKWVSDKGFWYYVKDSVVQRNWVTVREHRYLLSYPDGKMLTGWRYVDHDNNYDGTGYQDSNWYYLNDNGDEKLGWYQNPDGAWYYFEQIKGMVHGNTIEIDGKHHEFDSTGRWVGEAKRV